MRRLANIAIYVILLIVLNVHSIFNSVDAWLVKEEDLIHHRTNKKKIKRLTIGSSLLMVGIAVTHLAEVQPYIPHFIAIFLVEATKAIGAGPMVGELYSFLKLEE